jgi:ankyrin repeat protein
MQLLKMLIPHIADPNPRTTGGYTPLHLAALHGHAEIQAMLKALGAKEVSRTYAGYNTTSLRQSHMDARSMCDVGAKVRLADTHTSLPFPSRSLFVYSQW